MNEAPSKRNIVLVEIRKEEISQDKKGIGFNQLVERLKGKVSRVTISKSLDSLFDMGILDSDWSLKNGKWRKEIKVANESEDLVDEIIEDLTAQGLID